MIKLISNNGNFTIPSMTTADQVNYSAGYLGSLSPVDRGVAVVRATVRKVKSIIGGADNRNIVYNTQKIPSRLICSLTIESDRGVTHGTGWFASPNLVVTCGHCVYSFEKMGGWAKSITVTPGRNLRKSPYGAEIATSFSSPEQWKNTENLDWDIGAIFLKRPFAQDLGWFAYGEAASAVANQTQVYVAGYPIYSDSHKSQLQHEGKLLAKRNNRIFHDCDTGKGQSGSPIWFWNDNETPPVAIGIHAYEARETPVDLGIEANSGTGLDEKFNAVIRRWCNVQTSDQ
ncbi:MAG: trypsin-like serine peptidase [Arenicella sp.]